MRANLAAFEFALLCLSVSWTSDEHSLASFKAPPDQFDFGKNWQNFIGYSNSGGGGVPFESRVENMARALNTSFGFPFHGLTFIDAGCGSGLASLAALTLGVSRILSFDAQAESISATLSLRVQFLGKEGDPTAQWDVLHGSILDEDFVNTLTPGDLVYCYGVLHHTGDLWGGLRNLARLVLPDGLLFVAVHVAEHDSSGESADWLHFKKDFNNQPAWNQEHFLLSWYLSELADPLQDCLEEYNVSNQTRGSFRRFGVASFCLSEIFQRYASGRGMDFLTDARDWLGGYPYTWTRADELMRFCARELQPRFFTLRVLHEAVAGFLLTPADGGLGHYLKAREEDGTVDCTGHWHMRHIFRVAEWEVLPWSEFVSIVDGPRPLCHSHFGDDGSFDHCSYRAWALSEDVRQTVKGERCFVYMFPDNKLRENETLRSHFQEDVMFLEDLNILGWGAESVDDRFCADGGGARYRIWGSGLIVFSVWDDADPRTSGRAYQVLISPFYSGSFA